MKFLILNSHYQAINPLQTAFVPAEKLTDELRKYPHKAIEFTDKAEATRFAEFMARHNPTETFRLVEILDEVRVVPPVVWASSEKTDLPL